MSFQIKNPSITPGFAIYSPTQANVDANQNFFNFVSGTFQAMEGNGTAILTFEGGFRYHFCLDWTAKNVSSSANTSTLATNKLYLNLANSAVIYSRAYSAGQDQQWRATLSIDATADTTVTLSGSKVLGTSAQLSIWRFPL